MYLIDYQENSQNNKNCRKYANLLKKKVKYMRNKNKNLKIQLANLKNTVIDIKLDKVEKTVYKTNTTRIELYFHIMLIMICTFIYFKLLIFAGFNNVEDVSYSILGLHMIYITTLAFMKF